MLLDNAIEAEIPIQSVFQGFTSINLPHQILDNLGRESAVSLLDFRQGEDEGNGVKTGRKMTHAKSARARQHSRKGMTLIEVLIALAIAGLGVGAIISGYMFTVTSAERNALSLAANARAMQRVEEIRAAQWDTSLSIDQLSITNFSDELVTLDTSGTSGVVTYATNHVLISDISTFPPLRRIRVDCTWKFYDGRVMTNTIETCRAPDR